MNLEGFAKTESIKRSFAKRNLFRVDKVACKV